MLVDGLKIGGRDHARAVIPVSAISVVAGAGFEPATFGYENIQRLSDLFSLQAPLAA